MKVEAWIHNDRIYVRGGSPSGADRVHRMISSWPGWRRLRSDGKLGSLFGAPLMSSTVEPLLESRLELDWRDSSHRAAANLELARLQRALACLNPHPSERQSVTAPTARTPRPHQTQAVLAIEALGFRVLLGDEMGLGKSSTALWAVGRSACARLLVVCPKSVLFNWPKEIEKTLGERNVRTYVIHGDPKKRADQFAYIRPLIVPSPPDPDCLLALVMTWDILLRMPDPQARIVKSWIENEALILDESQNMKNRNAKRSEFALEHLVPATGGPRVRLALSGTPITNTIEDLWSQVEAVRPGMWTSKSDFVNRYQRMAIRELPVRDKQTGEIRKRKLPKPVGSKNMTELNKVMRHVLVRREKDLLDLPPKIHTVVELELENPEWSIYQAMKDEAQVRLEQLDGDLSVFAPEAKSAVEAALRCEQIAQGFVGGLPAEFVADYSLGSALNKSRAEAIPERPSEMIFPRSPKIQWLLEAIEAIGKPLVVFSRFNAPLFWLQRQIPRSQKMTGLTPADRRQELIDEFQDGKFDVMLCQVRLGVGFTLTRAHDVLFLGRDWSPARNAQAEDRCHRIGTTGTVNVQIPVVRNTIERLIHQRLAAKEADAEQALRTTTVRELMEGL